MLALIEAVGGSSQQGGGGGHNGTTPMPGVHVVAALPVQPLHMDILDREDIINTFSWEGGGRRMINYIDNQSFINTFCS